VFGEIPSDIGGTLECSLTITEDRLDSTSPPISDLLIFPGHAHHGAADVIVRKDFLQ
jgi:hypothetical protein